MSNPERTSKQTAILIVSWNVRDLVIDAVESTLDDLAKTSLEGTVWVVDNRSSDGTSPALQEQFGADDRFHLLEAEENLGFAGGNNFGLRTIGFPNGPDLPDYVLLLNPDTVVQPGAIGRLIDGLEESGAGLAGAQLVYGDGSFQHSAFAFPGLAQLVIDLFPVPARLIESRLNGRYTRSLYRGDQPFEIDHPLGATFLLRREVISQVGMFDERFHLYCEEIDWAMRIHAGGWRVVCVPTAKVIHYGGQSTRQVRPESVVNLWRARLQLYRKHYSPLKQMLAHIIIRAGMNGLIQQTARDSSQPDAIREALVNAYRDVIRLTRARE
jgi:GT2 family glycosyltransferase